MTGSNMEMLHRISHVPFVLSSFKIVLSCTQSETRIVNGEDVFFSTWDDMKKSYRGPSINASCQILLHFSKLFQMRILLRNLPTRNKNCPWWLCLVTDRDRMIYPHRGSSINDIHAVLFHLTNRSRFGFGQCNLLTWYHIVCSRRPIIAITHLINC